MFCLSDVARLKRIRAVFRAMYRCAHNLEPMRHMRPHHKCETSESMMRTDCRISLTRATVRQCWIPRAILAFGVTAVWLVLVGGCSSRTSTRSSDSWNWLFERAPTNVDIHLAQDFSLGVWKLHGSLAVVVNMVVLAGIIYAVARHEADFSRFALTYLGSLVGSLLLNVALSPLVMAWAVIPIMALNVALFMWCCTLPLGRACLVSVLYQVYQLAYITILREVLLR